HRDHAVTGLAARRMKNVQSHLGDREQYLAAMACPSSWCRPAQMPGRVCRLTWRDKFVYEEKTSGSPQSHITSRVVPKPPLC
ncbi:hypothetical protein, partial [Microbispora hainanensis]|uniref:hypothetical protein n=1 Tax=Microbispora hainanensis TaxID=568844 RepID=UPI0033FD9B31